MHFFHSHLVAAHQPVVAQHSRHRHGQASIDKVAGPVGESLIMTAIGLSVAVPAVLGYNWLVRRNKVAMEEVHAFGADLHAVLLGSAESGSVHK